MRDKSIKINMFLNGVKALLSVLFPLITFPYISRILGVDNIGRYNFSDSIVGYFILISGLGISTYSIREGARIRENKELINNFTSEMFSMNIYSMLFAYFLFMICIANIDKLKSYENIMLVLSMQILFKPIGVEWLFSIYEDYFFLSLRSIFFQIISICLIFLFVRTENDILKYAMIVSLTGSFLNVVNFLYAKRYCRIQLTKKINIKKHLKPVMIMFAMAATVTIYVSSDITILGFMCDDSVVGLYAVSSKIYTVIKTVISAVIIVSIPRLAILTENSDLRDFELLAKDIYQTLITILLPTVTGIVLLRKQIISLIAGSGYEKASSSLLLLSIALIFCLGAWFWGQCILISLKKDKIVFIITMFSALINILLNIILIPIGAENAAAFTTIIAELFSFIGTFIAGRKIINIDNIIICVLKVFIGCVGIVVTVKLINDIYPVNFLLLPILLSIVIYLAIEIILRNESVISIVRMLRNKNFRK